MFFVISNENDRAIKNRNIETSVVFIAYQIYRPWPCLSSPFLRFRSRLQHSVNAESDELISGGTKTPDTLARWPSFVERNHGYTVPSVKLCPVQNPSLCVMKKMTDGPLARSGSSIHHARQGAIEFVVRSLASVSRSIGRTTGSCLLSRFFSTSPARPSSRWASGVADGGNAVAD